MVGQGLSQEGTSVTTESRYLNSTLISKYETNVTAENNYQNRKQLSQQ